MSGTLSIGIIFLLSGFVQGLTGFGSALVAMPLLCLFLDVKSAVPLCALTSVLITSIMVIQLRSSVALERIAPLSLASLPGIGVGIVLLKTVDSSIIRFALGLLLVIYSVYSLAYRPRPRRLSRYWAWLAGFCSGAIGSAFSAGGPPTIIYTALNDWSKDEIKATLTGFFLINSVMIVTVHALTGLTTRRELISFLVAAPFILVGVLAGSYLYRIVPGAKYRQLVYAFLIAMGVVIMAPF